MSIFSKMMNDRKKTKNIEKKMKGIKQTRAYAQEADKLKNEFGLSDDEAVFMAKKNIAKQKRSETIGNLSKGFGNVLAGLDPDVQQAPSKQNSDQVKRAKGSGKKGKESGKKGKGSGKKYSSKPNDSKKKKDPLGMPELDLNLPGFKF